MRNPRINCVEIDRRKGEDCRSQVARKRQACAASFTNSPLRRRPLPHSLPRPRRRAGSPLAHALRTVQRREGWRVRK